MSAHSWSWSGGVRLTLESIWRVEDEEQQQSRLKAGEEACIVEEAGLKLEEGDLRLKSEDWARLVEEERMKAEQEGQARLKAEEEARLVEYVIQEEKEHEHAQLKLEEGVRLALEARRRAEEEDLVLVWSRTKSYGQLTGYIT